MISKLDPTVKSTVAFFLSLCFSVSIFRLPIVLVSFIDLSKLFIICISGEASAPDRAEGNLDFFYCKPQLYLYFYLSQVSCLCCLPKFYYFILQSFLCSCLNYLEAYKCLYLLRNRPFGNLGIGMSASALALASSSSSAFEHKYSFTLYKPPLRLKVLLKVIFLKSTLFLIKLRRLYANNFAKKCLAKISRSYLCGGALF